MPWDLYHLFLDPEVCFYSPAAHLVIHYFKITASSFRMLLSYVRNQDEAPHPNLYLKRELWSNVSRIRRQFELR